MPDGVVAARKDFALAVVDAGALADFISKVRVEEKTKRGEMQSEEELIVERKLMSTLFQGSLWSV